MVLLVSRPRWLARAGADDRRTWVVKRDDIG
jgi:hypothetical protein